MIRRIEWLHSQATRREARLVAAAALLLVMVWAIYSPLSVAGFVDYDDLDYVLQNQAVLRGLGAGSLNWALTSFHAANWHPLTWLAHMADVEFLGVDPGRHHLVSVTIHALASLLLLVSLAAMSGSAWPSALVALLFAVHPLHVESVAWIAERKDVLSALCWGAVLWAYAGYVRRPGAGRYLAVVVLQVLGLTAKPMAVTMPFVLLLLDFWPLGRLRREGHLRGRVFVEKVPLLILSLASSVVTMAAQRAGGAVEPLAGGDGLTNQVGMAAVAAVTYLLKTAWPAGLAIFYPVPDGGFAAWRVASSALVLAAVTLVAVGCRRQRPWLLAGWFWYLGTLVPVSGLLVRVGSQAMADRYTYIPLVGVFVGVVWEADRWVRAGGRWRARFALVLSAALLAAFGVAARFQAGHWIDSRALFGHALAVTERNWAAHTSLGAVLAKMGRQEEAIVHYRRAIDYAPGYAKARFNLGLALYQTGKVDQAAVQLAEAVRIDPAYRKALALLGEILAGWGRHAESAEHFQEALRQGPESADLHRRLARCLWAAGNADLARRHLERADELARRGTASP